MYSPPDFVQERKPKVSFLFFIVHVLCLRVASDLEGSISKECNDKSICQDRKPFLFIKDICYQASPILNFNYPMFILHLTSHGCLPVVRYLSWWPKPIYLRAGYIFEPRFFKTVYTIFLCFGILNEECLNSKKTVLPYFLKKLHVNESP